MKILIVTVDWASQGGGGLTRFSKGLVCGLRENGSTVEILLEEDGPHSKKSAPIEDGCIIHGVKYKNSPLKRAVQYAKALWSLNSKSKFDAIIIITWSPCGTGAFFCNLINKVPYWVVCHGNDVLEPQRSRFYTWLMKKVLRTAKGILPNSNFTANLVSELGLNKDTIAVIGCGITPEDLYIPPSEQTARERYAIGAKSLIVTIGRLVARKGQDMVIKAMPAILSKFPESVYMIIGEGNYKQRLVQLAKDLGVDKNVIFTGFISDSDVYQCVRECDIFAMVSRYIKEEGEVEGFGIVFLEAGYFKKPVIAGRAGGMVDPVVDGETGFLVNPTDSDDISHKIITLLGDKDRCEQMGSAGYERVLKEYTWDAVAQRVLAALQIKP